MDPTEIVEKIIASVAASSITSSTKASVPWLRRLFSRFPENLRDISRRASRRAAQLENPPGTLPSARVIKHVLTDGAFRDDGVVREYYAGLLLPPSDGEPNDDRAEKWCAKLVTLSRYEVRLHYAVYSTLYHRDRWKGLRLDSFSERSKLRVVVPGQEALRILGLPKLSPDQTVDVFTHAVAGLAREGFIEPQNWRVDVDMRDIECLPSLPGAELFLWAFGRGDVSSSNFLNADLTFDVDDLRRRAAEQAVAPDRL